AAHDVSPRSWGEPGWFRRSGWLSALLALFFPLHLTGWLDRLGHAGLFELVGTLLRGRPR
ncbi:hypothetical protein AB0P16_11640, partial [Dietzia maris]|uniref:hypothetical protein n=1 Tax=Dietzia maris TaxID=37915 RepID=UPI00342B1E45